MYFGTLAFKSELVNLTDNVALKICQYPLHIPLRPCLVCEKNLLTHEGKLSEQSSFSSNRQTVKFSIVKIASFQPQQARTSCVHAEFLHS